MIIVYAPAGGEREHFDARTLRVSETSIAQRTIDRKWAEIHEGIRDEDLECLRVVAWVIKKRSHPSLRWAEFDPGVEELYMRLDKDEVKRWLEGAAAVAATNRDATPDDIRAALAGFPEAALDREHAEQAIEEMLADPKEEPDPSSSPGPASETPTSPSSEPSTSGSSPTSSTSHPETSTT